MLWPPPRTATSEVLAAGELDRAHHVGDAGAAHDQRRAAVVGAVPDRARLVVAGVAGADHLAAQGLGELGDRPVAEHRLGISSVVIVISWFGWTTKLRRRALSSR